MRRIRIERPPGARFSEAAACRAVRFFRERLRHTMGRFAGRPFDLRPWQELDIREIFGRVREDGARVIRTAYVEMPKKNGKSEIAAGVALKLLFADDEPGAHIYGAAADREQASIVFETAASMVRREPKLHRLARIIDSTHRIVAPRWESFYAAVSTKVSGKHGLNAHGVIFDELHAQPDFRLWETLTFGSGAARWQPMVYGITTAGVPGESPVAEMLHEEADQILRGLAPCPPDFYPVLYGAGDDDPWGSEDVWRAANPALGDFLALESIREEFERARRRPSEQNSFRRFRLNQWVKQETRWIDMDLWDRCAGVVDVRELKDLPCYAGLDLSTKLDVTALVLVWRDGNGIFHWLPYFWIPRDNLADRPNLEAHKYRLWVGQGLITATEGSAIDFKAVRRRVVEISREVRLRQLAFDPAFATQLAQELAEEGIQVVEFRQSFRHYNEVCHEFEAALADGRIRHGGHPVLRWMADSVTVMQNADGMIRPVKPNRLKTSKRIDGMVAGLMGMSRAMLSPVEPTPYFMSHGLLTLE